jgi:biotin carboxyl carrier protein
MLRKFNVKVDGISYEVEVEEVHQKAKAEQTEAPMTTTMPTPAEASKRRMEDWEMGASTPRPVRTDIGANLKEIFNLNTNAYAEKLLEKEREVTSQSAPVANVSSPFELKTESVDSRDVSMSAESSTFTTTPMASGNVVGNETPSWSMSAHAPAWATPIMTTGGVDNSGATDKPSPQMGEEILTTPTTQWNMSAPPSSVLEERESVSEAVSESATATAVLVEAETTENTEPSLPDNFLSTDMLDMQQRAYAPSINDNIETRNNSPEFDVFQNPRMGNNSILAPVSGTIMNIPVREGTAVRPGDVLCVINTMGEESEILSPVDANVVGIFVRPGSIVNTNDILITLT